MRSQLARSDPDAGRFAPQHFGSAADERADFQRHAAETAIRPLMGVVGISNELKLIAKAKVADISQRIEDALRRQALREAQRVHVAVDGSTVKLTGSVHSWQERDAVQGVAWAAPGVRSVINEIQVV